MRVMNFLLGLVVSLGVGACGVDTASTAATGAAIKKQELEQGRKTMEQMQQKLDQVDQQAGQRAAQAGGER